MSAANIASVVIVDDQPIVLAGLRDIRHTGTRIDYALSHEGRYNMTGHSLLGRELRTLLDAELPTGMHSIDFHADE
jgi:hypothetical protein